tara:strand:- start:8244 stop:8885 length:642 start_codon:yes stop_codon:yes gene_type:complete
MLFDQETMEGWRSGQSQQTVNLPSLALRWFKSSSLHQIILFLIIFSSFSWSQDKAIKDPIQLRTYYFLEETDLSYKKDQYFSFIQSSTNVGLSLLDESISGMTYMFFGFSLYSFVQRPIFRSDLSTLSVANLSDELPRLQKKYKRTRSISTASTLFSAVLLSYLLATDTFSKDKKPTMIGVVSQIFSIAVTSFFFESSEEQYLRLLKKEYLDN